MPSNFTEALLNAEEAEAGGGEGQGGHVKWTGIPPEGKEILFVTLNYSNLDKHRMNWPLTRVFFYFIEISPIDLKLPQRQLKSEELAREPTASVKENYVS